MKILEVNNLVKAYKGFDLSVSFSIDDGETLALVGPNGSGKTTIIYTLLNVVRRSGGEIRFFGLDLDHHEVEIKQLLGISLEKPHLFEDLRVKHLLKVCQSFYPTWDHAYALALLEDFGIDLDKKFKKLSKGMKTKTSLAIAFAPQPKLLILDEPTSGLDPKMRRLFVEKVREARKQFSPAILLTSHIMKDVEDLADRVAFIEGGRIKLLEDCRALRSWRVIEGICNGNFPIEARGLRFHHVNGSTEFKLLTDDYGERLVNQIKDCRGVVSKTFVPDMEEVYDWIISSS